MYNNYVYAGCVTSVRATFKKSIILETVAAWFLRKKPLFYAFLGKARG